MSQSKAGNAQRSGLGVGVVIVIAVLFFLLRAFAGDNTTDMRTATEPNEAATAVDVVQSGGDEATTSIDNETPDSTGDAPVEAATQADPETVDTDPVTNARETAIATSAARAPPGMPLIMLDELPAEAVETLMLIAQDGPFPYSNDGSTFQNREGLLPDEPRGYYAEYTVETPGSDDRGARRIVAGDGFEYFYTDDHYNSFSWIVLVE